MIVTPSSINHFSLSQFNWSDTDIHFNQLAFHFDLTYVSDD